MSAPLPRSMMPDRLPELSMRCAPVPPFMVPDPPARVIVAPAALVRRDPSPVMLRATSALKVPLFSSTEFAPAMSAMHAASRSAARDDAVTPSGREDELAALYLQALDVVAGGDIEVEAQRAIARLPHPFEVGDIRPLISGD